MNTRQDACYSATISEGSLGKSPFLDSSAWDLTTIEPNSSLVLWLNLTNRCNLRCVYCPEGTHAEDFYADSSPEQLERVLDTIRKHGIRIVKLSFYGETTLHSGWTRFVHRIADLGCVLHGVFNFARLLTKEELAALARFSAFVVSVDTFDRETLRQIRRSVDVRTVLYNLQLFRAYCAENRLTIPEIWWSAVLTDQVLPHLRRSIAAAAANGVKGYIFNPLGKYASLPNPGRDVCDLRGEELVAALQTISEAVNLAARYGLECTIRGLDAINLLAGIIGRGETPSTKTKEVMGVGGLYQISELASGSIRSGQTRDCVMPWTDAFVGESGQVYACCQLGDIMGHITADAPFADIFNQEPYRAFRRALLTGKGLGPGCKHCPTASITSTSALQKRIASLKNVPMELARIPS